MIKIERIPGWLKWIMICSVFFLLSIIGASCQEEENANNVCDFQQKIKDVNKQRGIIWYAENVKTYAIYSGVDGTYDTQEVGIPCNLMEEFKVDGLNIIFSGEYYKYVGEISGKIPGQQFYHVELTEIVKETSKD